MSWSKPAVADVWRAIEGYLSVVYGGKPPPSAVAQRLETLRACPEDRSFWECPVFERDHPAQPTRFALRLGNPSYPHMKLVIERAPDGKAHFFRADTHDRHIAAATGSREQRALAELMSMNQALAERVEVEWARLGVPTFRQYLRDDLERRSRAGNAPGPQAAPS